MNRLMHAMALSMLFLIGAQSEAAPPQLPGKTSDWNGYNEIPYSWICGDAWVSNPYTSGEPVCRCWGKTPFSILACLMIFSQDNMSFLETTPFEYLLTPPLLQAPRLLPRLLRRAGRSVLILSFIVWLRWLKSNAS